MTDESMMELRRLAADAILDEAFMEALVADPETGEIPIVLARTEESMRAIFEQLGKRRDRQLRLSVG